LESKSATNPRHSSGENVPVEPERNPVSCKEGQFCRREGAGTIKGGGCGKKKNGRPDEFFNREKLWEGREFESGKSGCASGAPTGIPRVIHKYCPGKDIFHREWGKKKGDVEITTERKFHRLPRKLLALGLPEE